MPAAGTETTALAVVSILCRCLPLCFSFRSPFPVSSDAPGVLPEGCAGSGTSAALPGIAIAIRTAGRLRILLRMLLRMLLGMVLGMVLLVLLKNLQSRLRYAGLWRLPHDRLSQGRQLVVLGEAAAVEPGLVVAHGARIPGGAQRWVAAVQVGKAAAAPARHGESGGEKRRLVLCEPLARTVRFLGGKLSICCVEIVVHVHSYPLAMATPGGKVAVGAVRRIPNVLKSINANFERLDAAQMNDCMQNGSGVTLTHWRCLALTAAAW